MKNESYTTRVGETAATALNHKISKCYQAIESLLDSHSDQAEENSKLSRRMDAFDEIQFERFESHTNLLNNLYDGLDKCFERIGKLENYFAKVVEQNKRFDVEISKILKLVETLSEVTGTQKKSNLNQEIPYKSKSFQCPSCKGAGEILNNERLMNLFTLNIKRRDALGNIYHVCDECRGSGVIVK